MTQQSNHHRPDVIYSALSWREKLQYRRRTWWTSLRANLRVPWRRIAMLGAIVLMIGLLVLIVRLNQREWPLREGLDKSLFLHIDAAESLGDEWILDNGDFRFVMDPDTTQFTLEDNRNGQIWSSNPTETADRFQQPLLIHYAGSLGQLDTIGVFDQAVAYRDYYVRLEGDVLEILYEVGGKKDIDSSDFPPIITDERMQALVLDQLTEGSLSYRRVTEQAYTYGDLQGEPVWKLKDGIQSHILERLYTIFYDEAGYTAEDLAVDLEMHGILLEDRYPYFEVAIRYELTEEGLSVRVRNDSIVEKEIYPIAAIDVLPYFGAGTTTDDGYILVPDGSGGLIDFNSDRSFALPYNQRIYGPDDARSLPVMPPDVEAIRLPVFGISHVDAGFVAIADENAAMASIYARIASPDNPYNQAYYRVHLRESETYDFASINSSVSIRKWTEPLDSHDFVVQYQFIDSDSDYVAMAERYRTYLLDRGTLDLVDATTEAALHLTLLGGYEVQENILGIPYTTVRSLTTTENVLTLAERLREDGIANLHLYYSGFANEGLTPSYMGDIDYDRRTGRRRDMENLANKLATMGIGFAPELQITSAYTSRGFSPNRMAIRDVFDQVLTYHAYDPATLLANPDTRTKYLLHPNTYSATLVDAMGDLERIDVLAVALAGLGSDLYGSYGKDDFIFRSDAVVRFVNAMSTLDDYTVMLRDPNAYAVPYASVLGDVPTTASNYQIISRSVPFYQLVFSGYVDYFAASFNLADERTFRHHVLQAIETTGHLSLTWSYEPTIDLVDTEYSMYYSTFYENWYDLAVSTYQELNDIGIHATRMIDHAILSSDGSVTKTTYANGMEILFNYRSTPVDVEGVTIDAMDYVIVKEGS
jgi:hypothetical protein